MASHPRKPSLLAIFAASIPNQPTRPTPTPSTALGARLPAAPVACRCPLRLRLSAPLGFRDSIGRMAQNLPNRDPVGLRRSALGSPSRTSIAIGFQRHSSGCERSGGNGQIPQTVRGSRLDSLIFLVCCLCFIIPPICFAIVLLCQLLAVYLLGWTAASRLVAVIVGRGDGTGWEIPPFLLDMMGHVGRRVNTGGIALCTAPQQTNR